MSNIRSSKRLNLGAQLSRSSTKVTSGQASSSSAKGSRNPKSDENASLSRRVLGEIQNVVADRKPAVVETSGSPRKPFSDRNAPVSAGTSRLSGKSKPSASLKVSRLEAIGKSIPSKSTASTSRRELRSPEDSRAKDPITASSSLANTDGADSSQINSAKQRIREAAPSHDELTRLSPGLDSDDLGYFDVSALTQNRTGRVASKTAQRGNRDSESDDKISDVDAIRSNGSSDKENVPPTAAVANARARNRPPTHSLATVLGDRDRPTRSTPVSSQHQAAKKKLPKKTFLDDIFLDESDHSSRADSPGVARRAEVLTESAQQLQEYQDRGVNKVMAWKAAGHDGAFKTQQNAFTPGSDAGSTASWPADDARGRDAAEYRGNHSEMEEESDYQRLDVNDDNMDEFGFLLAERNVRDRRARPQADEQDYDDFEARLADDNDSNVFVDLHTEPPVNTTSDDRRLAESAFGRMSSPASHARDETSSTASSVVVVGLREPGQAEEAEADSDEEDDVGIKFESNVPKGRATRASTRTGTKRKVNAAAQTVEGPSPSSSPPQTRKGNARTAKSSRLTSGIPLKRTEKEEIKMLERLAADSSSSPADSSAPSSSRHDRRHKDKTGSSPAKKLRMDELINELPRSRSKQSNSRANKTGPSKKKSKAGAGATRRGDGKGSARTLTTRTSSRGKAKKIIVSASEEEDEDEDESPYEELPTKRPRRSTKAQAKNSKGKRQAKPKSDVREDWRSAITSSQIHSDDSERTKRLKEFRAAEKYQLAVEDVL
ncbi:hypothetical protein PHSY_003597 [Pseudozyma hubeiensis SY62]|uniref:Uncharacterized protein n=1 Tax=Pseudozyma hubeiensis (strain SY62) TaxID=1305764 RepID=R9P3J0_PSEHS|nr:hypothetical protein PHSY_003597 [Pseudozyma hubeiensis SY62]GAC96018.1 hypothetical protein PHSY_003597 [Pseudozyma hubeiensis SY62]